MLMNVKMRELVTRTEPARALSIDLAEMLQLGFVDRDGCTLLATEANKTTHIATNHIALMDATGYECFVNHLHVKSFPMALLFAGELGASLRRTFQERFVVILSFDGSDATVRFHKDRPGTPWLDVNELENFKEEAVGVVYSS
jgi:hypothetical protein